MLAISPPGLYLHETKLDRPRTVRMLTEAGFNGRDIADILHAIECEAEGIWNDWIASYHPNKGSNSGRFSCCNVRSLLEDKLRMLIQEKREASRLIPDEDISSKPPDKFFAALEVHHLEPIDRQAAMM